MSVMTLWSEQCCSPQWLVNLNSGLSPKLSRLVSVFGLSERLFQKVKWPSVLDTYMALRHALLSHLFSFWLHAHKYSSPHCTATAHLLRENELWLTDCTTHY